MIEDEGNENSEDYEEGGEGEEVDIEAQQKEIEIVEGQEVFKSAKIKK
jgi:hypothetical protein